MAMADFAPLHDWSTALAPLAGWPESRSRPGPFARLAIRYFTWRARRETIRALNSVDCATLRDLGITDIESVVYGPPEGRKRSYDPDWWKRR